MAVSKIVFDNRTLINLEQDTITADRALSPYTMHLADGTTTTGTIPTVSVASPTISKSISGNVGTITSTINQPYGFCEGGITEASTTITLRAQNIYLATDLLPSNATKATELDNNKIALHCASTLEFPNVSKQPIYCVFTIYTPSGAGGYSFKNEAKIINQGSLTQLNCIDLHYCTKSDKAFASGLLTLDDLSILSASYDSISQILTLTLSSGYSFYPGECLLTYYYIE